MNEKNYQVEVLEIKDEQHSRVVEKERTVQRKVAIVKEPSSYDWELAVRTGRGAPEMKVIRHEIRPVTERYTTTQEFAATWAKLRAIIRCMHCQTEFHYEWERQPNGLEWPQLEESFRHDLSHNLVTPPPRKCPKCKRYQNWMIHVVAETYGLWALWISWLPLIALSFISFTRSNLNTGNLLTDIGNTLLVALPCFSGILFSPLAALLTWGIAHISWVQLSNCEHGCSPQIASGNIVGST